MAIISQCNVVCDLVSELASITVPWTGAYVKEDGGFYFRNATAWIRNSNYVASASGTVWAVVQGTSKATPVALNKACGDITLNAASLAVGTAASFTLTNSLIAATDLLDLQHQAVGTFGAYTFSARCAAGSAILTVRNNTAAALAEAVVLRFSLIKGLQQ